LRIRDDVARPPKTSGLSTVPYGDQSLRLIYDSLSRSEEGLLAWLREAHLHHFDGARQQMLKSAGVGCCREGLFVAKTWHDHYQNSGEVSDDLRELLVRSSREAGNPDQVTRAFEEVTHLYANDVQAFAWDDLMPGDPDSHVSEPSLGGEPPVSTAQRGESAPFRLHRREVHVIRADGLDQSR
jgi:hypothetical protein